MKISDLAPILLTEMEVLDANNQPTGVFFQGHTPISKPFETANRRYFPQPKSQSLYLGKKGEQRMEIPTDPNNNEKRVKVLAEVTTGVFGLEDFDSEKDSVLDLFQHPAMAKAVEQWREHMDDEGKHTAPSDRSAKRMSKSSAG